MDLFFLTAGDGADPGLGGTIMSLAVMILPFVALVYFMIIRPEKKRKKQEAKMFEELVVGVEVTTRSGILGKVVSIKDDTVLIESGSDKCRIRMLRSAIVSVNTPISS